MYRLLSDKLIFWKEAILASYPFHGLLHKGSSRLHTPFLGAKNPSSKWPGGHKSNAESKIYTVVSFQFTKNSIFPKKSTLSHTLLQKFARPLRTSLFTLPPLQTLPRRGPHRHLASVIWRWVTVWSPAGLEKECNRYNSWLAEMIST